MSKQFWAVLVVIVLVLIGVFAFTGDKSNKSGGSSSVKPSQNITGEGKSGVNLVEYGDFECPFCEQYEGTLEQVRQLYGAQIHFQFRNFPLTSVHPNAYAASRAAEAAALQGKFWEMHDTLYQPNNWSQWSTASGPTKFFNQYAQQIGLNVEQFKTDFASDKVNAQVSADLGEANKLGLTGTPTFFLDGKQVQINNTLDDFKKILDAEIAKKQPAGSTTTTQQ